MISFAHAEAFSRRRLTVGAASSIFAHYVFEKRIKGALPQGVVGIGIHSDRLRDGGISVRSAGVILCSAGSSPANPTVAFERPVSLEASGPKRIKFEWRN